MKTINKILIVVFAISLLHSHAQAQWSAVSSGTSNFLTNVEIISTVLSYAAGFSGTVLKSTNNGQTWQVLTSPSASNINKMFFVPMGTGNTGWAATVSGLYKSTNGGVNWTQQIAGGVFADLLFSDLNTGFALTNLQNVRKTTDGGANFSTIAFTTDAAIHGQSISPGNGSTLYLLATNSTADSSYVFKSTNSGASWSKVLKTAPLYLDMVFVNLNTGIICGENGSMKRTTNAGVNWSTINTGTTNNLQGIKFIATTKVFAVGAVGTIIKSTDGGATWVLQVSNTAATLRGIDVFSTDDIGFAVGQSGIIMKTTNGGGNPTGIVQTTGEVPQNYSLSQNYPNPFNPSTDIQFAIPKSSFVKLVVYDMLGREVETLVNEELKSGTYKADWNAVKHTSGVYIYKLTAGDFTQTKKMVLVK